MARIQDRQKVLLLRQQGKTYSEIRQELGIAKSTLSDWLRNFPLTKEQMELLERQRKYKKQVAIEKTRIVKQQKREVRLKEFYEAEKRKWVELTQREIELAGLFLYWGEGNKGLKSSVSLNNTDPKVVKFALYWLVNCLSVSRERIRVGVHLYSDMNIDEELDFWSKELQLPRTQFMKPYIKQSKRIEIDQKGFGHGTCGLYVHDSRLKERIIMGINAIAHLYSGKLALL